MEKPPCGPIWDICGRCLWSALSGAHRFGILAKNIVQRTGSRNSGKRFWGFTSIMILSFGHQICTSPRTFCGCCRRSCGGCGRRRVLRTVLHRPFHEPTTNGTVQKVAEGSPPADRDRKDNVLRGTAIGSVTVKDLRDSRDLFGSALN